MTLLCYIDNIANLLSETNGTINGQHLLHLTD